MRRGNTSPHYSHKMAYEIPQQLEHKEKIMFNLTIKQLGWASLFGFIALAFILKFENMMIGFGLALVPVLLGVGFVFFDLGTWISNVVKHIKKRNVQNQELSQFHNIQEINKNSLTAQRKVAVVEVTPMNFKIKTKTEQDSIMIAFQKFLNSFDVPLQIAITTQKLTIDKYLEILEKRSRSKKLFTSFNSFIKKYIAEKNMMNRKFYIVIPESSQLDIQCEIAIERLNGMGVKAKRLSTNRIIDTLNLYFNGIAEYHENDRDIISKVTGLEKVETSHDHLKINGKFYRVITATGYPRTVDSGFLDKIISSVGDFDISIHVQPFNIQTMMVNLNNELIRQKADLYAEEKKGLVSPSLEIKYKDTRHMLEELQKGEEKLFQVSLYIGCKADTSKELDLLTKQIETELNSSMIIPHVPLFRQADAFRSMLPCGFDYLRIWRNVPTKALSAFYPFTSPYLNIDNNGAMLGLNRNNVPIIRDIFALSNPNGLVLATSGAGKSYFTKLLILRQLMNGTKVMIIDPQSEYEDLVNTYGGQTIRISRDSESIINPLDLMGHDFLEKRLSLMDLFKIMFGELTEVQKSILDRALTETYKDKRITVDSYLDKTPPVLSNLYKTLVRLSEDASAMEKLTYSSLINRLYVYTSGVFNFLNKKTNIDFNSNLVCFDIGDMPKQVKPVVMFLILDFVYMKMKTDSAKKLLIVDEAWSLLSRTEEASYLFEIVKTCRKYNMGMLLITQDVMDLVNSKAGHAVLANSAYSLLLRQKPAIIKDVVKTFSLSNMEREYLLSAVRGNGILIMDNEHQEMTVVASPEEHELIVSEKKAKKKESKKEKTPEKEYEGLYKTAELTSYELNYLSNQGYEIGKYTAIGDYTMREYIVKVEHPEKIEHSYHVKMIVNYLKKISPKIETKLTSEADILFTDKKGKEYFIEVETGMFKDKKKKIRKLEQVREKYGSRCIVFLTKHTLRKKYAKMTNIELYTKKSIGKWFEAIFKSSNKGARNERASAKCSKKKGVKSQNSN